MVSGPYGLWHIPCHDQFFQPLYAATARAFDEMTQRNRDYWLRPTGATPHSMSVVDSKVAR